MGMGIQRYRERLRAPDNPRVRLIYPPNILRPQRPGGPERVEYDFGVVRSLPLSVPFPGCVHPAIWSSTKPTGPMCAGGDKRSRRTRYEGGERGRDMSWSGYVRGSDDAEGAHECDEELRRGSSRRPRPGAC